ncbi:MAG: integrase arm-type DNA-binding domain-containing protein [Pseudomonadota bacterium]
MPLTDLAVRKSKPRERAWKLSDGGGLYLFIAPEGGRYWRFDYRLPGKRKTLSLGVYPQVSLAAAREKRDTARKQLSEGVDPALQRKLDRLAGVAKAGCTFRLVAAELLDKMAREGRAAPTLKKARWVLKFAYPHIGERPISEISPPEVLAVLRTVEARGHYETARRLRSTCGKVFRLAIASGRAQRDPTQDLRGALIAPKTKHRAAIVEPRAIGALMRAIDGYDGHSTTRGALQLLALTFVRPGELRHAEWSEFDLDAALWSIPASKMKMRRPHRVPLARQALAILQTLEPITGEGRYVFPSVRAGAQPMSDNTLNAGLRRLGFTGEEMTAHGFRAMAAVRLNEMGNWNPDAIERQLAHQEPNSVRRAYTHAAEFWSERIRMMSAWADYLDQLRTMSPAKAALSRRS